MKPHDDPADDSLEEEQLRQLFAARRQRDEAAAPGYERLRDRPARALRGLWQPVSATLAVAGLLVFALVALGIVWKARSGSPPSLVPAGDRPTFETWKAPTDFLLAVPGGELLDSTPAFPDPDLIPSANPRRL